MENLKVGMTCRVFEVLNDIYGLGTIKVDWSIEVPDNYLGNKYGINLFDKKGEKWHFGIDKREHARLVGRLKITKLKC